MKKNSQLHIMLETDLIERLKREADGRMISLAELCRLKLKGSDRLEKIERLLERVVGGWL
jgi:hypothetical protein